ncbi:hypothetical protein QBC34DRAFT_474176 [Podospora aff. communis PSN243]|uniref:Uncharacterized protein n=1 Tax=Podospora aff. communis PSN243 TaxID=3040156 RepID=A0AAV9GA45_9PEZI|nr:hypothetical protein QBC34DRAFT_474176 [Podospora aff. communis PSN243]
MPSPSKATTVVLSTLLFLTDATSPNRHPYTSSPWLAQWNLSPSQYQTTSTSLLFQSYRPVHIASYPSPSNPNLPFLAVIWENPPPPSPLSPSPASPRANTNPSPTSISPKATAPAKYMLPPSPASQNS